MRIATRFLGQLNDSTHIRVVGVQLRSPFFSRELIIPELTRVPTWDAANAAAEKRVLRIRSILDALLNLEAGRDALRIFAFPEYAVPGQAHQGDYFQARADAGNCILIPGSYFQPGPTSSSPGKNVCHIYVPRKPRITIEKSNPTPAESNYVSASTDAPNIAHLMWTRSDNRSVSVNVFLCRDYLWSLREFNRVASDTADSVNMATQAEFADEGLNIALMHSDETRLFEGVSGIDLRGLRGQRRLALFVNAANTGSQLGSALIGASGKRERDDVVCSISPDKEGVITADVRLWQIEETKKTPDRRIDTPIKGVSVYNLVEVDGVKIQPATSDLQGFTHRAIWRPAFLEALSIGISIEFFVATKITQAMRLLRARAVRNVYAATTRGEHDIVIRYYARQGPRDENTPHFIEIMSGKSDTGLREALRLDDALRFQFLPQDILKYRGLCTSESDYRVRLSKARKSLGSDSRYDDLLVRRNLVKRVLALVEGCESSLQIPDDLKPFLFDELEKVIPMGAGSHIRETYILVMRHEFGGNRGAAARFDDHFICKQLMGLATVREIFKFSHTTTQKWDYLLKMKSTSREADAVTQSMREWADENDLNVATRTIDVTSYLSQFSLAGIASSTRSQNLIMFIGRMEQRIDAQDFERISNAATDWTDRDYGLLLKTADAWGEATEIAEQIQGAQFSDTIFDFYSRLLLHFTFPQEDEHFDGVRTALLNSTLKTDREFKQALKDLHEAGALGPTNGVTHSDDALTGAIRKFAFSSTPDDAWSKLKGDVGKQFFSVFRRLIDMRIAESSSTDDIELAKTLKLEEEQLTKVVKPMRNLCAHGDNSEKLKAELDLSEADWSAKIERLAQTLLSIMTLTSRALYARKLAKVDHFKAMVSS